MCVCVCASQPRAGYKPARRPTRTNSGTFGGTKLTFPSYAFILNSGFPQIPVFSCFSFSFSFPFTTSGFALCAGRLRARQRSCSMRYAGRLQRPATRVHAPSDHFAKLPCSLGLYDPKVGRSLYHASPPLCTRVEELPARTTLVSRPRSQHWVRQSCLSVPGPFVPHRRSPVSSAR